MVNSVNTVMVKIQYENWHIGDVYGSFTSCFYACIPSLLSSSPFVLSCTICSSCSKGKGPV